MNFLSVLINAVFVSMIIFFLDVFMFLNADTKYKGFITMRHYKETLKMPLYRKTLMSMILKAVAVVTILQIVFSFSRIRYF